MTAGICPARRVRRASFLPREARTSAATVISLLNCDLLGAGSKSVPPCDVPWVREPALNCFPHTTTQASPQREITILFSADSLCQTEGGNVWGYTLWKPGRRSG